MNKGGVLKAVITGNHGFRAELDDDDPVNIGICIGYMQGLIDSSKGSAQVASPAADKPELSAPDGKSAPAVERPALAEDTIKETEPVRHYKKRKTQLGGWSDRDIEILKAEKLKRTKDRDIAKKINHSEKAIGVKWCMMNKADKSLRKIKKSKAGHWTAEEDKWLQADFSHSTEAELCKMLNRPAKEVHARIIELKNSGELQ